MATFGAPNVQGCPFAIPVKRNRVFALVLIVKPLKILVFDSSCSFLVKQAERYLIFCVWFREQILECAPVRKGDASGFPPICNLEEYRILFSPDFMLHTGAKVSRGRPASIFLAPWERITMLMGRTYVVFVRRCNSIDKLLLCHVELSITFIFPRMSLESSLCIRRQRWFDDSTDQRLLYLICDCGHGMLVFSIGNLSEIARRGKVCDPFRARFEWLGSLIHCWLPFPVLAYSIHRVG